MPGLAFPECCPVTRELVRIMTNKIYGAFIASLGAMALMLAADETFGASGIAHVGRTASTHPIFRPLGTQSLRHHRGNDVGVFWPGAGDYGYGSSNGEPMGNVAQPTSGDVHYTYTYDVPWDAVHRFPPAVTHSEPVVRSYVPGCPAQVVTVPGSDGKEQTINIVRCY